MPTNPASNAATTSTFAGANTNRAGIIFRPQLAFDEPVALGGRHFQDLRFVSETLAFDKKTEKSPEITGNRGTADLIAQTLNGMGGISGLFSADTWDWALEAVLCGAWALNNNLSTLQNGNLSRGFLFEKRFLDVGQFEQYLNMEVDALTLTLDAESDAKIDLTFAGSTVALAGATLDPAPVAKTTTPIIQTGATIGTLLINGNPGMSNVKTLKLEIKNSLRTRPVIYRTSSIVHGQGDFDVTVTLTGYFKDAGMKAAFVNNAPLSTTFTLGSAALGYIYTFGVPILKIPTDSNPITGRNADVMETVTLNGLTDANGLVMSLTKQVAGF